MSELNVNHHGKSDFHSIQCSSSIVIYAHQNYDIPLMDAMNFFWPTKIAKLDIKEKMNTFYTMELEKSLELGASDAPCNADLEYTFTEGGTDIFNIYFLLT